MANYKIRLQIIATANDDGSDAANITSNTITGYLPVLNQIMSPAEIEFVFDPVNDFLKINSTLLNRDFTPLEKPNVGTDKWDHEPEVDSDTHSAARTSIAMQFRKKLVVIYRKRKKLDEDDDGNWYITNKGGGSSSAGSYFVNMSTSSNAIDLGHEIGHYLHLPHTFTEGVADVDDAAAKIKAYVDDGNSKDDGLNALDGDRAVVLDTPADCKGAIFESEGLTVCGPVGEILVPVNFGNEIKLYTLAPDRNLVMSYFKGCSETGDKTISPQQARRIRDGLEMRNRHDLISIAPSLNYVIHRGGSATGGAVSDIKAAHVRAGRFATAVIDSDGNLKVIVWDVEDGGKKVRRKGSASAGGVQKVSITGIGLNHVATAVITSGKKLKVIIWKIRENGDVERMKDADVNEEVNDVACCISRYNMGANYMATAVRLKNGSLKVHVWKTYADGRVALSDSADAGKVNSAKSGIATPGLNISWIGASSLVTFVRDEDNSLRTVLWYFDEDNKLHKIQSTSAEESSPGVIAGCNVSREVALTAFQDSSKNLRLRAAGTPFDGKFIEHRGVSSAGSISDVAVCGMGTEMAVTGVKISGDKLKLILWNVTRYGGNIARAADKSANDVFSKLSMCPVNTNQFVTAMRDGSGNIKIVAWYLLGALVSGKLSKDVISVLLSKAKPERIISRKINAAMGGACGDESGN